MSMIARIVHQCLPLLPRCSPRRRRDSAAGVRFQLTVVGPTYGALPIGA